MDPRILCYDCDSFFVAVSRLAWPDRLAGVELLVVGGHPERRGVVASCSYGAREYGVHSGMPMSQALKLCPGATATPVPWGLVRRKSREVRAVIQRHALAFEAASVDEGYLTVADSHTPLEEIARSIQQAVKEETEITISLGGSYGVRYLAKMATSRAKPAGVYVIEQGEELAFLDSFPLSKIPGIGPAFFDALQRRGITHPAQARGYEIRELLKWLGPARAQLLYQRSRGIDRSRIGGDSSGRRSISSENTFDTDLSNRTDLEVALGPLVADVGRSLRKLGYRARTIGIKLRSSDFQDHQKSHTLREAVETDRVIGETALALLRDLHREVGGAVRLLGVSLSNLLGPGDAEQLYFREIVPPLESEEERAEQAVLL